ncbi:hypothetical protein CLBKND_04745 [Methylorubrum aminovorans]
MADPENDVVAWCEENLHHHRDRARTARGA